MKNFNISLPSIPSSVIQFKIKNTKCKGFNAKQSRFKENMSYLASHFIKSFPNLLSEPPPNTKEEEQHSTAPLWTNVSSSFKKDSEQEFRWVIGENKRNLLIKYQEQYKNYHPQIEGQNKYNRGYSFAKKNASKDSLDQHINQFSEKTKQHKPSLQLIENYYFKTTEESINQDLDNSSQKEKGIKIQTSVKKREKKSAIFQCQDRWRSLERELNNKVNPGPGSYLIENRYNSLSKKQTKRQKDNTQVNISKIMSILTDTANPQTSYEKANPYLKRRSSQKSRMFIQGNLDRFGKQIYPISDGVNKPGPGSYEYLDTLEQKANRLLIHQEQKKLLKQWYRES